MSNINALCLQIVHPDLTFNQNCTREKKNQLSSKMLLLYRNVEEKINQEGTEYFEKEFKNINASDIKATETGHTPDTSFKTVSFTISKHSDV